MQIQLFSLHPLGIGLSLWGITVLDYCLIFLLSIMSIRMNTWAVSYFVYVLYSTVLLLCPVIAIYIFIMLRWMNLNPCRVCHHPIIITGVIYLFWSCVILSIFVVILLILIMVIAVSFSQSAIVIILIFLLVPSMILVMINVIGFALNFVLVYTFIFRSIFLLT